MQFSVKSAPFVFIVLVLASGAKTTPLAAELSAPSDEPAAYVVSHEQMMHWIATTDAELTFAGTAINPLTPLAEPSTTVTYCVNRVDDVCGGPCTVYTGAAVCLSTPNVVCLSATNNIGFCTGSDCQGTCGEWFACNTSLNFGFCATPGTASILMPE
ncbi:hypothetical protein BD309DRAFT_431833 [Dichomitus squalens]|uniref:Uncharacterized protein n=2 Tax=Dichomitus squalens TaxID=114155 RepID=A0A4Q9NJL2_9APHY|nr:uncharacterized protein DICSQDRAFT_149806 [Dichomitus squalens LYAD-421 SS1]EJF57435.1 hypothetical protein DICSQDRAFT_149806 [Dichomitus squalens LYAD-421 SS1]TBU39426.1 hypothetical protein BD309DRAFT_431833 [Dichomitus squalens]TBU59573.1 hypothetical protein BD310DRAFT_924560 [Dichomitus squalens]